jgi:hypothetical protein
MDESQDLDWSKPWPVFSFRIPPWMHEIAQWVIDEDICENRTSLGFNALMNFFIGLDCYLGQEDCPVRKDIPAQPTDED